MVKILSLAFITAAGFSMTEASETSSPQKVLQDSTHAVKYFEEELDFTTNPHGAKMALEGKKGKFKIIDVRSREAFAKGHIPGALNIPFEEFDKIERGEPSDRQPIKDGFNYVYCYETLCNLSQKACLKLASLGYPVKEIKGGFTAWQDHKYPVEQ